MKYELKENEVYKGNLYYCQGRVNGKLAWLVKRASDDATVSFHEEQYQAINYIWEFWNK